MKDYLLPVLTAVLATFAGSSYGQAYSIATREVQLNGYNLFMDSFDSSDPALSTNGHYDPAKGGGDGSRLGALDGIMNANNVGTVDLWGGLDTGVPYSLGFGPASVIGSALWHLSSNAGIEPGYHTTNFVWSFPDVALPFGGTAPVGGTHDGVQYDYILGNGDYRLGSLTLSGGQTLLVTGAAQLVVAGNASLSGNGQILILPTASLRLFVAGRANLRGNGVVNQGVPANFLYLGTPSNTELNLRINTPFIGGIYAPSAVCTISSTGGGNADMQGAVIVRSVELGANLDFHYDAAPSP